MSDQSEPAGHGDRRNFEVVGTNSLSGALESMPNLYVFFGGTSIEWERYESTAARAASCLSANSMKRSSRWAWLWASCALACGGKYEVEVSSWSIRRAAGR